MDNVDYLSDDRLYPPRGLLPDDAPYGTPTAKEVREAALSLMLNPNAMWARDVLMIYANVRQERMKSEIGRRDAEYFCATLSLMAGLTAQGIHLYDRYKRSLKGFLFHRFYWAERQLLNQLSNPPAAVHHFMIDPNLPIARKLPWNKPYQGNSPVQIEKDNMLARHMSTPRGLFAAYPQHQGGKAVALGFTLLYMSTEELLGALESCETHGTPVSAQMTGKKRVYSEPERQAIFDRFADWWREQERPPSDFDLAVFERYYVYEENEKTAFASVAADFPDNNQGQAHNSIYGKSRNAYKDFAEHDSQLARDEALNKLYTEIKKKHT